MLERRLCGTPEKHQPHNYTTPPGALGHTYRCTGDAGQPQFLSLDEFLNPAPDNTANCEERLSP